MSVKLFFEDFDHVIYMGSTKSISERRKFERSLFIIFTSLVRPIHTIKNLAFCLNFDFWLTISERRSLFQFM